MPSALRGWLLILTLHIVAPEGLGQAISLHVEYLARAHAGRLLGREHIQKVRHSTDSLSRAEVVARMQYLGKLKRRMYRCHIDSDTAPNAGDEIESTESTSGQGAGKVVSVAPSVSCGYDLLAVIENNSVEAGRASVNGTPLTIKELPYSLETE